MLEHPFTNSTFNKVTGSILILAAIAVQWGLLILYVQVPVIPALTDSILSVGMLAAAGYAGWFSIQYIQAWQAQVSVALLIQLICLAVAYSLLALFRMENTEAFVRSLPLRFIFGLLCWIILIQWYRQLTETDDMEHEPVESLPQPIQDETIDRVSVKDGARIHIVHIHELLYLQACGDYVTLITADGQYVKEQTMKYFESHLPSTVFVRIHRSFIVNTNFIRRVELFGKESYQIKLTNGVSLRASNTGYKLLKDRLNL